MSDDAPHHDQLPLPDYGPPADRLAPGRIRSLDADALEQLLAYERAHGNRLPVVQLVEQRMTAVRDGAPLSGGNPTAATPEQQDGPQGGSQASPLTQGPPVNPPSHGDPTNPAQPKS